MSRRRDFLILSALMTAWWAVACLPRVGRVDHWTVNTPWSAGWPIPCASWSEAEDGSEHRQSFSARALALDVAWWLWALLVVWVVVGLWTPRSAAQRPAVSRHHTGGPTEPVAASDSAA
jgi:hypothetical protein